MSLIEDIEAQLEKLSQNELRKIREWLDDLIEDDLEFTPEFEKAIGQSEDEMSGGLQPRTRQP